MISRYDMKGLILNSVPAEWSTSKYSLESNLDELYDYFEAEIQERDSRTCESCKLWVKHPNNDKLMRCSGRHGCEVTGATFYCALWEKKDDTK